MDKRIIQRAEPYLKNLKFTGRVLGRSMKKAAGLCAQGAESPEQAPASDWNLPGAFPWRAIR